MANFILDVDFTMSRRIEIEAENEEQAKSIFEGMMKENPYDYARRFDALVGHKVIDVTEEYLWQRFLSSQTSKRNCLAKVYCVKFIKTGM